MKYSAAMYYTTLHLFYSIIKYAFPQFPFNFMCHSSISPSSFFPFYHVHYSIYYLPIYNYIHPILLSSNTIVTAAHCATSPSQFKVSTRMIPMMMIYIIMIMMMMMMIPMMITIIMMMTMIYIIMMMTNQVVVGDHDVTRGDGEQRVNIFNQSSEMR